MTETKPDYRMILSAVQLEVIKEYTTKSLDSSDQSKWGEKYTTDNELRTSAHNDAIRIAVEAFSSKLLKLLEV